MCGGQIVKTDKPLDPVENERIGKVETLQKEQERYKAMLINELERVSREIRNSRVIHLYKSFYMSIDSELDSDNKKIQLSPFDDAEVLGIASTTRHTRAPAALICKSLKVAT